MDRDLVAGRALGGKVSNRTYTERAGRPARSRRCKSSTMKE
jgi:hypothetical protein